MLAYAWARVPMGSSAGCADAILASPGGGRRGGFGRVDTGWWYGTRPACACAIPRSFIVESRTSQPVRLSWQAPGLLGTPIVGAGGERDIPTCTATGEVLPEGDYAITVHVGDGSRSIPLLIRNGHRDETLRLRVGPGGAIEATFDQGAFAEGQVTLRDCS